jgi:hypothetical protein
VSDDRLDEALRALPAQAASAGFTAGVVARVSDRPRPRRWLVALASSGGLAALVVLALRLGGRPAHREDGVVGEIEALRREQRALAAELAGLRALAPPPPPQQVIYLGQSAGVDLVLDLARLQHRPRPGAGGTTP